MLKKNLINFISQCIQVVNKVPGCYSLQCLQNYEIASHSVHPGVPLK